MGSIFKVAVTGGAGSGKTSVCNRLKSLGFEVIDADAIARAVVSPGSAVLEAIAKHFGSGMIRRDGSLDRTALRRQVVKDISKKQKLERIIHPLILERMQDEITTLENQGVPAVIVEVPLLFELNLAQGFDMVVTVISDREQKTERLCRRDRVTREDAEALLDLQLPDEGKIEKSDFIIDNKGSIDDLYRDVDRMVQFLNEKSRIGLTR